MQSSSLNVRNKVGKTRNDNSQVRKNYVNTDQGGLKATKTKSQENTN